jgi:hypothetical protein
MAKARKKAKPRRRGTRRCRTRRALGELTATARGIDAALARGDCAGALEELLAGAGTVGYSIATGQRDAQADAEKMKSAARRFLARCLLKGKSQ